MLLATLRKLARGPARSHTPPARRKPGVEELEDRRVPALGLITWVEGEVSPPDIAIPLAPAPLSAVVFALDGATYGNRCEAERAHGGTPTLSFDEAARTIDVVFVGPVPDFCLAVYQPVSGLVGGALFLQAGDWVLRDATSAVPFTIDSAPLALPVTHLDTGLFSYYRYSDPTFRGEDLVIEDRATWERFWTVHKSGMLPTPPLPEVDFEREMVIVTLMGYHSSSGPYTSIDGVVFNPDDGKVTVSVTDHREPGPLPVVVNPYDIVKVPRAPYSEVVFEHHDA